MSSLSRQTTQVGETAYTGQTGYIGEPVYSGETSYTGPTGSTSSTGQTANAGETNDAKPTQSKLVDIEVKDEVMAINLIVSYLNLAQRRGAFSLDESSKLWECIKMFQKPV